MKRKEVEERTLEYHEGGLCCTEAILKSIAELYYPEPSNAIPRMGSGFCKGIGKTGLDVCGTVAGGVMAIGYVHGRDDKDGENTTACDYATEFRKRFVEKYGTTNCAELLLAFGEQVKMAQCKAMTADASGMIADILDGN